MRYCRCGDRAGQVSAQEIPWNASTEMAHGSGEFAQTLKTGVRKAVIPASDLA